MVLGVALIATAASVFDITFPIPELGNCADRQECRVYCDDMAHSDACTAFAQAHGLGNSQSAKKTNLPSVGPGGCTTGEQCKTYCDDTSHYDECLTFGQSHGLLSRKEVRDARDAAASGPGGCSGLDECKIYCSDSANELECAGFANKQGQISSEEYKKIKELKDHGGPGGCKSSTECKAYCQDAAHVDECISFGESHGFVSHDDAVAIRKAGIAGPGPGGCQGNEACHEYCAVSDHQNECVDYAQKKGIMTKDEADTARKFAGKIGPGGCKSTEECRAYCEDSAHGEECLLDARARKLLSEEEITKAQKILQITEQGGPGGCKGQKECQAYCKVSDHQEECFAFAKKQGLTNKQDESEFETGRKIHQTVQQNGGPGGCKDDGECKAYCSDASHGEECLAFASAHGGISDSQARSMLERFIKGKTAEQHTSSDELGHTQEDSSRKFDEYKQLEQQFRNQGNGSSTVRQGQASREADVGGKNENGSRPYFVGPGGCTNAVACISYCADHKDECFKQPATVQGQEDSGSDKTKGGNFIPKPQLRSDIIQKIDQRDLPQGFEQRTPQEKRQFFQEKFQESRDASGASPVKPSQEVLDKQNTEQKTGDNQHNNEGDLPFKGVTPQKDAPDIVTPIQKNQQDGGQISPRQSPLKPSQVPGGQQGNMTPLMNGQNPAGMPGQKGTMPGVFHPQEKGFPSQPGGQFQIPSDGDMRSGSRPPLLPAGNFEQQKPPMLPSGGGMPGASGTMFLPSSGGDITGGSQPPSLPSGGMPGGGTQMPPSSSSGGTTGGSPPPSGGTGGGIQMPFMPSTFAPLNILFAGLIQVFFPR